MNYYTLLQVPTTATEKEIQKAYRTLAKKHHPDRLQQASTQVRRQSEEKLKLINVAYTILSDATKRQQYDATLPPPPNSTRWQTGTANTKRTTQADRRPYDQPSRQQKAAHARSEYLRVKSDLRQLDQRIIAWLIRLGKTAGLVGVGSSLSATALILIISWLLAQAGLSGHTWGVIWQLLYLFIIQAAAILVVVHHLGAPFNPIQDPRSFLSISGMVLVSLYQFGLVTPLFLSTGSPFPRLFTLTLVSHMVNCLFLGQAWLKPLLAERRQLESRLAVMEEMLAYFNQAL